MTSALQIMAEYEARQEAKNKEYPPPQPKQDHCEAVGELIEEHPSVDPIKFRKQ